MSILSHELNPLFSYIRSSLFSDEMQNTSFNNIIPFNNKISQVYITLYQEGQIPLRFGSLKNTFDQTLNRIIQRLKLRDNFVNFDILDKSRCRILFEIVTKQYPCNIRNLTTMRMNSPNRFEPGVNGLKYKYKGITRFFMPSDGYTKSIMSVNQLLNHLSKQCKIARKTDKISERVHLMRREPIEYTFINSDAYISYNDDVLELERGYPLLAKFDKNMLYDKTIKSIDWLVKNMNDDGSFLYYYDPYKDTIVDDMHPNMIDPLYNNILRHSGGTVSLIRGYELTNNKLYLKKAKDSIEYFLSTFREHKYKKEFACYPFFNKKSKLGGAGIGLVAMMHYYIKTGDENNRKYIDGLVRHILSRVDKSGEMIGYYIHPMFNNSKAILHPNDEVKKELFSFYYPGEALLGLALYYIHIKNINKELKKDIKIKSEMALDFLVDIRPIKYDYMFTPLPADAWLMQAIEEWVKVDDLKKQSYIDFVFNDTKAMFDHMYTDKNTLETNKDYIGGFYYEYGEHVYHDASRCEGVVSAYYLAKYLKDEEKASWIMKNMLLSAKGLMKTFHDEKSVYPHIDQQKALHSFRFKLTRQWVRVDSVQHAACFFARLIPIIDNELIEKIDNYQIIKTIGKGGFAKVFLVKENNVKYALKLIHHPRYINRITQELKALEVLNNYPKRLKFYKSKGINDDFFLLFEYAHKGNLKRFIDKEGIFDENKAIKFLIDIIDILKYTKSKNLLHLDIKPANILLHKNKYWLADWGLSEFQKRVKTLHIKGNPIFLAPEMYRGFRDFSSEIYALGATLYYVVTGNNPYELKNSMDDALKYYLHTYHKVDTTMIQSNKIVYLLNRMLDKNPETRATIQEIEDIINMEDFNTKVERDNKKYTHKISTLNIYEQMSNDAISYAQNNLAKLYTKAMAFNLYYKSATLGLANGQCNVGIAYLYAKGTKSDLSKAFEFLQKASSQGHDKAQYYLGTMYENGIFVKKNQDKSLLLYIESAKNGYKKAYEKLDKYNYKLTHK